MLLFNIVQRQSLLLIIAQFVFISGCTVSNSQLNSIVHSQSALIRAALHNVTVNKVFVVAHRAAWKNAPENSLQSVIDAIEMKVDIIEIDIRKTKDGQFILMHDSTVDRTTNGTGNVNELTLAQLKTLSLTNSNGQTTHQSIPTLDEVLKICKDKILINLDKTDAFYHELLPLLKNNQMSEQVILKGKLSRNKISKLLSINDQIIYMSKLRFANKIPPIKTAEKTMLSFNRLYPLDERVKLVEITFGHSDHPAVTRNSFELLKNRNVRVWINTLQVSHSAQFTDVLALKDPNKIWGKLIDKGVSVIQTDEPLALLNYLRSKGLHD